MGTNGLSKEPLNRDALRDVIDLALWAGQLLLHNGAESQRVEETVHRLGTGLGCNWMDILVSPNVLIVTTTSGDEFRTKVRRVVGMTVNMGVLTAVNDLSRHVELGIKDRVAVRAELERIDGIRSEYNRWVVVLMVGLACAGFSRLFAGDWPNFFATWLAASSATLVHQELSYRHFNHYLIIMMTAFSAGTLAGLAQKIGLIEDASTALAASALLLVPGVPLINAAEDLLKGHNVTGVTRALIGGLISMTIALGLLLAITLLGISGL